MSDEPQADLTIIGGAGRWPAIRRVSERTASWEWESLPRREPTPARDRLRGLAPWRLNPIEAQAVDKPPTK